MTGPRRVLAAGSALPLHDVAATRALEQQAQAGLPPQALMLRAGAALARLAIAVAPHARRVWVAAGAGNNGGDGLEAALLLQRAGREVSVTLVAGEPRAGSEAADALGRARAARVPIAGSLDQRPAAPELAIDALLGIGVQQAPRAPIAAAIDALNGCGAPLLAVDLPSGLHADSGRRLGADCVRARHTLSLLTLKPGLFTGHGRDACGEIWFDPLGVEPDAPTAWLAGRPAAPGRRHAQHKGSFGDVVLIGGARGMAGAALLAGRAALAAGAGRVFVAQLDSGAALLDAARPELMLRALDWATAAQTLERSTVVCGCGGGDAVAEVLDVVLARAHALLLDADALNAIAADSALRARLRGRAARGLASAITPHPLEAARLLGLAGGGAVQADRLAAAQRLADELQCCVLLKGSGSVVAAPGEPPSINPTGNAALASPGTGDVLAGWIGGRWAATADAASTRQVCIEAAWHHGAAADRSAAERPLRAADLIEAMHRLDASP